MTQPRWRALAFVLAASAAAVPAAGQHGDGGEVLSAPALLARLRSPTLELEQARALAQQLPVLPVAVRLQASDALRAALAGHQTRHADACRDVARALAQTVARHGLDGAAKSADAVAALRGQALALSRRGDLTKAIVQQQIDPLMARLAELVWPAREAVLDRAPELAAAFARLQQQRAELPQWYSAYAGSLAGLELHPDAEQHLRKHPPPPPPLPVAALDDEWTVWTMLATALSSRDRKTLDANESRRAGSDPQEFAGTTALNRRRFLLGLPLLRLDPKLANAARDHSADMDTLGFFDHTSPVEGKRTPGERAARFGTSAGAENIANGHDTGAAAIEGWWYSPGHHRNMLGGHARTGLGRSAQLWTQLFGG